MVFGLKVVIYPFNIWLPEVHTEANTVGSILLAGVLLKVGLYGLIRYIITIVTLGYKYFSTIIIILC